MLGKTFGALTEQSGSVQHIGAVYRSVPGEIPKGSWVNHKIIAHMLKSFKETSRN